MGVQSIPARGIQSMSVIWPGRFPSSPEASRRGRLIVKSINFEEMSLGSFPEASWKVARGHLHGNAMYKKAKYSFYIAYDM